MLLHDCPLDQRVSKEKDILFELIMIPPTGFLKIVSKN